MRVLFQSGLTVFCLVRGSIATWNTVYFFFLNAKMNLEKKGRASKFCRFHKLVNSLSY